MCFYRVPFSRTVIKKHFIKNINNFECKQFYITITIIMICLIYLFGTIKSLIPFIVIAEIISHAIISSSNWFIEFRLIGYNNLLFVCENFDRGTANKFEEFLEMWHLKSNFERHLQSLEHTIYMNCAI